MISHHPQLSESLQNFFEEDVRQSINTSKLADKPFLKESAKKYMNYLKTHKNKETQQGTTI